MPIVANIPAGEWSGANIDDGIIQIDFPDITAETGYRSYYIKLEDWAGGGASDSMAETAYEGSILLDNISGRDYDLVLIESTDAIELDATGIKDGGFAQIGLIGDGTNVPSFTNFNKFDANGLDYDETLDVINIVIFFRYLQKVYYNIIDQYSTAIPTLVSAETLTNGLTVVFTFSRDMANPTGQTDQFTFSPSKTVSSVEHGSSKAIINVTVSPAFEFGDTITVDIGTELAPDGLGDNYEGADDQAVVNNLSANYIDWTNVPAQLLEGADGKIEKISADATWDSGAASVQSFAGNVRIEAQIGTGFEGNADSFMLGFNADQTVAGYAELTHAIFAYGGGSTWRIMEGGAQKVSSWNTVVPDDGVWFAIERSGTAVTYQVKNGANWATVYTSLTASNGTIYVGVVFNKICSIVETQIAP